MLKENPVAIPASIFRSYDIRGVVGETLTADSIQLIGKAIGSVMREANLEQIALAYDGRVSSPMLANALSLGILSTGCDVIDYGMIPTPLLYYAAQGLTSLSGVMLTGSHNPPEYNGIKMVIGGTTFSEEKIQALHTRILNKNFHHGYGMRYELTILERYINHVTANIHLSKPLKIVIDAGNGVTGMIAPRLFRALGCDVHEMYCNVDGTFPNHEADPSQVENLQDLIRTVKEKHADVGLAFDGDGDRLGVVTNQGEIIWPDRLLMLFAQSVLKNSPQAKIIYDVKCTSHLSDLIYKHQGQPIMWKTGHSLIKSKLIETNAALAGEMSGHFFFNDRWLGFDDALYAGARLLEILSQDENNAQQIFSTIPNSVNTPELKISIADEDKFSLMQKLIEQADFTDAKEIVHIDGLRVNFIDGWGLLRVSNTSPNLILRFEAINEAILENIQLLFRNWILKVQPNLDIPF